MLVRTYDFFDFGGVGTRAGRREVVGRDRHAHHEGAAGLSVVWVEVGEVGKVNGGGVVDTLQGARSVKVADDIGCGLGLGLGRTF